jgi:hypothetical protein
MDRIDFSEACLRQYRKEFEPGIPWREISKRLRRELKNHGRPIRRKREYLRIRTRRLDVVLNAPPSDVDPIVVEELVPLPSQGKRRRRQGKGRRRKQVR